MFRRVNFANFCDIALFLQRDHIVYLKLNGCSIPFYFFNKIVKIIQDLVQFFVNVLSTLWLCKDIIFIKNVTQI
jgi:hypothetical protein